MQDTDRLEFLKNEREYLEAKIKKYQTSKYPDKEQQAWYLKLFRFNLQKINTEITELQHEIDKLAN